MAIGGILAIVAAAASVLIAGGSLGGAVVYALANRGAPKTVPGWRTKYYGKMVASPKIYAKLTSEFVRMWAARFGEAQARVVEEAIHNVSVHHFPEVKNNKDQKVGGRMVSIRTIYLATKHAGGKSGVLAVLQHEFIHVALEATTGDGDPDHSDNVESKTWTAEHDKFEKSLTNWLKR